MPLFIGHNKSFQTLGCISSQEKNYILYTAAASISRARKTTPDKGEYIKNMHFHGDKRKEEFFISWLWDINNLVQPCRSG